MDTMGHHGHNGNPAEFTNTSQIPTQTTLKAAEKALTTMGTTESNMSWIPDAFSAHDKTKTYGSESKPRVKRLSSLHSFVAMVPHCVHRGEQLLVLGFAVTLRV
jgi:hypothetical protein